MASGKKRSFLFEEGINTQQSSKKHKPFLSNKRLDSKDKCCMSVVQNKRESFLTNNDVSNTVSQSNHIPLAEKMRPSNWLAYVGQINVVGPNSLLRSLLEKGQIPSMILWGPPGCGKTTLATIITHMCKETLGKQPHILCLSAVSSGINAVREAVKTATTKTKCGQQTIVIMDEIHRFNKLQQDIFLPHVEAGTFILIGATTENPSYSLNSALLSRCRVFALSKLSPEEIKEILHNAIASTNGNTHNIEGGSDNIREISGAQYIIDIETIQWLAEVCDGDARVALGGLELAIQTKASTRPHSTSRKITLSDVKEGLKQVHRLSDRETNQSQHIYSALHKSIKAGKISAAMYWLARIMATKEDPVNIARRFVKIASEEIGLADPDALGIAVHAMHGCQMIGMPECDVLLAQCVVYLCKAPKSHLIYDAFKAAEKLIIKHIGPQPAVPMHIRDRSGERRLQTRLGIGREHLVRKNDNSASCLPCGLEHIEFFEEDDF